MAKGNRTMVNIDQTFLTNKYPFNESSLSSLSSHPQQQHHHHHHHQIITSDKYNKQFRYNINEQSIDGVDDLTNESYLQSMQQQQQKQQDSTLMANKLSVSSLPIRNGINYSSMNGTKFRKYQSDLQSKMNITKMPQLLTNKAEITSLNESPQSNKSTAVTLVVPTSISPSSSSSSQVQMTSGQISNTSNQTATTSVSLPSVSATVGQRQNHGKNYQTNISLAMMTPNNLIAGNQQHQFPHSQHSHQKHHNQQQQQHQLHSQQNKQQQPLLNSLSMLESSSSSILHHQQQQQHQPTVASQQMINNNNGSHHPHHHHHNHHQYYEPSPIMSTGVNDHLIHTKSNPNHNQLLLPTSSSSSIFCTGNFYRLNGIGELLASLALMCILSLLMAFLALSFIQRSYSISQLSAANAKEYVKVFQISVSLSTLTIALDLCCLFVCCIQFLSIIKLLKTPFGVRRSFEFIRKTSHIRIISIGAFLVSIPIFFTGVILYTFVNFDEIPALITSIIIGIGIIFCGIASVQNVYLWQWEKTKASQEMQQFYHQQQQQQPQSQQQQQNLQQQQQSSFVYENGQLNNTNNLSSTSYQQAELSTLV
uniref:Protein kinase 4-like isoform X2 n=1 Tax=Dermatophagoides pteronyssinus TaxID=6956 RepID=A0A6P6YDS2_DERPT|nr:protein kinase 4-like isoform X2 [Dermatophagoides pteronyssinus]